MNNLIITNGSYNLEVESGENFTGESVNLLLITAEDTITIFDRVSKRLVPIINCLVSGITLNGKSYTSAETFEAEFKKLVEEGGGSSESKVEVVDELPEVGEDGTIYIIRVSKNVYLYNEEEGYIILEENGKHMSQVILTYDGNTNTIQNEDGTVLTMEEIISLVENKSNFVYLIDDFVLCLPSLNFYDDAFEFTGTYVLNGYTTTARVIINSSNEVSEYHLTNETTDNLITEIDNEATNDTYPSSRAVYDLVESIKTPRIILKFTTSGEFSRSEVWGNNNTITYPSIDYNQLKNDIRLGAFILLKDDTDTLVNPEIQLLPAQFDDTNTDMDIFLVGYAVGRYNYTVSVKSDNTYSVVKTPYNNIWNGNESDLPETQQPGVLYLINE